MSTVNEQITDAVTQTNVNVIGEAPAQAMGTLFQVVAHSNGLAMENAVSNQQNLNQLNATIVAQAIATIVAGSSGGGGGGAGTSHKNPG